MKFNTFLLYLVVSVQLLAASFVSPFPATRPSIGYTFVPALSGVTFSDPDAPEILYVPNNVPGYSNYLFSISRDQRVTVITNTLIPTRKLFLNVGPTTAYTKKDCGMPGFAIHPDGKRVYTFESETRSGTTNFYDVLRCWQIDPANPFQVLPIAQSTVLIEVEDPSPDHLGGSIWFDKFGYLYVTLSDGGGQDGIFGHTQKIDGSFFSAVMRLDVDNRPGSLLPNPHPAIKGSYRIPSDNPFIGISSFNGKPVDPSKVRTEFVGVGFRNPHSTAYDWATDAAYIADVGNIRWESLFRYRKGMNAGWNWREGLETFLSASSPPLSQRPPVVFDDPIWTYPHSAVALELGLTDVTRQGNCIITGLLYRGTKYPALNGALLVSDYMNGNVWACFVDANPPVVQWLGFHPGKATSWAVDPKTGDILAGSFSGKSVMKLVPSVSSYIPSTLSETGLFKDTPTLNPEENVLPYEVAHPFWSDGAVKSRWVSIPVAQSASYDADDVWTFPTGTVWAKHFDMSTDVGQFRIETRFLVKTLTETYGLTYRWRPNGLDADLVPAEGADAILPNGQQWRFPGWSECSSCHNEVAGYALGFNIRQLNVPAQVEGIGEVNQLEEFSLRGLITPPITNAAVYPALSRLNDSSVSMEHRFKSYTDANCGYCHRPNGSGRGNWNALLSVPFADSGIVNGTVNEDLGIPGSKVILPGSEEGSVLLKRLTDFTQHGPAAYHMPPFGTFRRNEEAVQFVRSFIYSTNLVRPLWQIGTNGPSTSRYVEFAIENRKNDPAPGLVPPAAGSPVQFKVCDDYYTKGIYPAGFNGLTAPLVLTEDEPWMFMERANTVSDRTNRIHLVSDIPGFLKVTLALFGGGSMSNGVVISGFSRHDMSMRMDGVLIWTNSVISAQNAIGNISVPAGPHTLEIVRHGPNLPNKSEWINYDYVLIEQLVP